jgi:hypothetical protein
MGIVNGQGYAVTDQGDIFQTGLTEHSTTSKIAHITLSNAAVADMAVTGDNTLLIATSNGKIWEFDPSSEKANQMTMASNETAETIQSISLFGSNVYVLDVKQNTIWRYTKNKLVLESRQKYNKGKLELSTAQDMTIDGSIYILNKDGTVDKYSRGQEVEFKLGSIPKPFDTIKKPIAIYTDENSPAIYILDNNDHRILEFDKNGQFNHLYVLPVDFKSMTDFTVQTKGQTAFVVNDGKLYQINL